MTKKLRWRIMFIMMLLLSLTFISIITAINIWLRADNRAEADNNLRFLLQREMKPDGIKPDNSPSGSESFLETVPDNTSQVPNTAPFKDNDIHKPDIPEDHRMEIATSHFILVRYSSDNQLISIENTLSDSYCQEDIKQYCDKILARNKRQGTLGNLRYIVHKNQDGTVIAFIDHTAKAQNGKKLLMISIVLGFIGLVIFAILSYILSGLMVHPVEEAFQKQKQFISDASHELKTPLAVILSNSELLEDQIGKNRQLAYIKKECDQMHHLVTSLLTLSNLEQSSGQEEEKNTFSLSDALLERILPLESIAYEKEISMQYHITPDISFYGVKAQLQQVATILIDNALTYTDKQGKVDITLDQTHHHIILKVCNTGDEIPEKERTRLFERFYRMDSSRNRAKGHYGLGLSIAKTIVTNHKGQIRIECKSGVTSFIVTWKISRTGT